MPGVDPNGHFRNWTTDRDGSFVRRGLTKSETLEFQHHLLAAFQLDVLGWRYQRAVCVRGVWTRARFPLLEAKEGRLKRQKRHRELQEKHIRARAAC